MRQTRRNRCRHFREHAAQSFGSGQVAGEFRKSPHRQRVAVNRIWAQLFGTGLVATEEDFGSSGEPPSHPQLLDFLALRFQTDHAWSIKRLLRDMVLSSTYRQASQIRAEILKRDPDNRLLAQALVRDYQPKPFATNHWHWQVC